MKRILLFHGVISCWISIRKIFTSETSYQKNVLARQWNIFHRLNNRLAFSFLALGLFLLTGMAHAGIYDVTSTENCIATTGGQVSFNFPNTPPASSAVTVTFYYRGDLNGSSSNPEKFDFLDENSNLLGSSTFQSTQCDPNQDSTVITVPVATFNSWIGNGSVDFVADADATVSATLTACAPWGGSCAQVRLQYLTVSGPDDAGASAILPVANSSCPASLPVSAVVQNYGTNQITSLTVNWSVDGVTQTAASYSGTLDTINGAGNSSDTVALGNYLFSSGNHTIIAWTTGPNGNTDTVNINDSATSLQSPITAPQGLDVTNVTSSGADISWTSTGATSYNIIYGVNGFDPATSGTTVNSTTSPATLTSLSPGTAYDVYLVGDCGSGAFTDTAGPESFSTLCVALTSSFTLPFSDDFESYAGPAQIGSDSVFICNSSYSWSYEKAGTSGELLLNTTAATNTSNSGSQAAIVAGGSGSAGEQNNIVLTVNLSTYDTTGIDKVLEFFFRDFADEADPEDRVSIRGDVGDPWVEIYDWSTVNPSGWEKVKINLTNELKAANQTFSDSTQIRWSQNDNVALSGGDGFGLDDVSIEEVACLDLNNVAINNITFKSGQIVLNGEPAGTAFNVVYGPCGFNPAGASVQTATGTDSIVMTNLLPSTCYDVYVIRNCTGSSNGFSDTTGAFSFTSSCLLTAPIDLDFESGFSAGATGSNISPCISSVRTTDPNWEVENASGANENTSNTGPFYDNTDFGNSGGYYVYLETSSGTAGDADTLSTVLLDISTLTHPYLSFAYHMYGADIGSLTVEVFDNGTWSNFTTITGQQQSAGSSLWKIYRDTLTGLVDDTIRVRFIGVRGAGSEGDISLDDIQLLEAPTCIPSRLFTVLSDSTTSSSTTVNWVPGAGGKYEIEYGYPGFIPGVGALGTATVTDTFYTITGLTAQTPYEVYVRDSCAGGYSGYVGPVSFTTDCNLQSLPYFENFTVGSFPTCWSRSNTTDVTYESTCGNQSDVIEINYEEEAITPVIDVSGASSLEVSYLIGAGACTNDPEDSEHFHVEYWDGSQWVLAMDHDGTLPNSFVPQSFIIPPGGFSTDFRVRFNMIDGTTDAWQIDDVEVRQGPNCFEPAQLGVHSLTDTSGVLNWLGSPSSTSYEVWFGPKGFYQGTQSTFGGTRTFVTSDTLLVDTLASLSCYEYLVRAVCTPSDTTSWVGPFDFCTKCPNLVPMTLPYFDGFEAYSGPVTQSGTFFCGPSYSWAVEDQGSNGNVVFNYTASSGPTPPYNGSQSAGLASQSSNDAIYLIFTGDLSAYDTIPNLQMLLSFYYADHLDETGSEDKVWVRGDISDSWIEILDWNAIDATTNWQKFEIRLDSVLAANNQSFSSSTQVRWGQMDNAAHTGGDGFSVDDFMLQASTCPAPSNLAVNSTTTTTANISWTSGGASDLQIEYGPRGFTPGSGQFASATTSPHTLTGLTAGTVYEMYIRDSCGVGDVSFPVGPVLFKTNCSSALSGTYTIGATGNFATFDSVSTVLNNCGVSGPVTFNVLPGTYTDHLHLLGIPGLYSGVPGLSATNTITFNGNGNTIIWDGVGPQATILLDGSGHVTIDSMTVVNNASTEGWGILLSGNSDSVTISNSTIIVDSSGSFAGDVVPILVSGDAEYDDDFSYGADVDGLTITGNEIIGGYHGLQLYGNSTSNRSVNYRIEDNIIRNFYISGIYMSYHDGVEIIGNTVRSDISVTSEDGLYLLDIWNYNIEENDVRVKDYALYITDGNDGASATAQSTVVNNMIVSTTDYAIYLNDVIKTNVYHNSTYGEPGMAINDDEDLDIQNNIFVSDNDFAFESFDALDPTTTIDYNLYYKTAAGTSFDIGTSSYADLVAWQTGDATRNANSVEGDPLFIAPDDLHVIGGLANDVGNNTLGITVDIDGDARPASGSTVVDMGADEYTPVSGDLAVINGEFRKGLCLTTNDSVEIWVENLIGGTANFTTDPLTVSYNVTGPANTSGSVTVNTGTLPAGDTLVVFGTGIDLSVPGNYVLNAWIDSNAVNSLSFNDTLVPPADIDVDSSFVTTPKVVTLSSATDTVEICVQSSFFGGGSDFFFSEIRHFDATGAGPQPPYLTADDYIEITGVPGSDLGGITLEVYSGTSAAINYTFPSGTLIGPNGTALIMHGQGAGPSQPANFMYDGRGTSSNTWSSGSDVGYVLKDGNTVIDAVTYDSYTFPASAGVTAADWSGQVTGTSGTAGIRLIGPDNNSATDWTVVSTTVTQDPQVLNANVPLPIAQSSSGFTWTYNGNVIDTNACTKVAPGSPGTYTYYANYTNGCGTFIDSVKVIVPSCLPPSVPTGGAISASSVYVTWDTTGLGTAGYELSYGPSGFTPASGTIVSITGTDSTVVTGIANNLCNEYYIRTVCGPNDSSLWAGPVSICPDETICTDDMEQYATGLIEGQSALFLPWQGGAGAAGTASISTAQASSGTQSLHLSDPTGSSADDVIAYFDTISSGLWKITFDLYVPTNHNGYFNLQQNHALGGVGTNLWGGEIYFMGNGTAEVEYTGSAGVIGSFTYAQAQWNEIATIVDLANDSVWFELNGTSTGVGYDYSSANGLPLQFNGINFYTGKRATDATTSEFFVDDFCVAPYSIPGLCAAPTGLAVTNFGCDSAEVSWNSTSGSGSSILEYGPTGFSPGSGTVVNFINSPYTIQGLTPGTTYDFYVADTCANDTSALSGPVSFITASGPLPKASFTTSVNGFKVTLDATASLNADNYSWDFGDLSTGTGDTTSHTYATGGNFTIQLTVSNACGTDDTTIVLNGVNLVDNTLDRSLVVYPNPATDEVNISMDTQGETDVTIRILDLSGKEVMSMNAETHGTGFDRKINIGNLADGVYMLEISSGGLTANKRLIKQ